MDDELIEAHGAVDKLMPYLHLPVQSGSDRILAAMNRQHTAEDYLRIVDRLRAARPDLALSSDFIVGFPGETDADFAATLRLVGAVGFAGAYSFKFSARPGTPAATMENQVPQAVSEERLAGLQQLLGEQETAFHRAKLGAEFPVLVEKPGRKPGQVAGRSPWMQAVVLEAPEALIGSIVKCRIVEVGAHSLHGEVLDADAGLERICA